MQLTPSQLQNHLQKGLHSLYTLHGDEPLLVQEAADAIRATARAQGYTERSSYTVAGAHFDWSEVLAAGGSLSLFAERQMLELRIPSGKPGKEGSSALQQLAEQAQGKLLANLTRIEVELLQCLGPFGLTHAPLLVYRYTSNKSRVESQRGVMGFAHTISPKATKPPSPSAGSGRQCISPCR